jgi:hypothetical protein
VPKVESQCELTPTAPVIIGVDPTVVNVGDLLTINGNHFGNIQGTSKILFGSIDSGRAKRWSDTTLQVSVPPQAGTGTITVRVGNVRTGPVELVVAPKSPTTVHPSSGPSSGGTRVAIVLPAEVNPQRDKIFFGSLQASCNKIVSAPNSNLIICNSPQGFGQTSIEAKSGELITISLGTFTYR